MNKLICLVILLPLFVLACSSHSVVSTPSNDDVRVIISDNGLSQSASDVLLENYHKGAEVDVAYLITNNSSSDISPVIYPVFDVRTKDYSKGAGYVAVPSYYSDWVDIPSCGTIKPGESKSYSIVLKIPNNKEKVPNNWAFKTGVAGNNGGLTQTATELWWRVNMR